jgi:hypothetical protein
MVPWLEKLRRVWRAWRAGGRGPVLLRLRLCEKRGTCGAAAARSMLSFEGSSGRSGTDGAPALLKERFPGIGRGRPFATRIESRIGFLRRVAVGGVGEASSVGTGGREASSWRPIEEWLRKERAVSQT